MKSSIVINILVSVTHGKKSWISFQMNTEPILMTKEDALWSQLSFQIFHAAVSTIEYHSIDLNFLQHGDSQFYIFFSNSFWTFWIYFDAVNPFYGTDTWSKDSDSPKKWSKIGCLRWTQIIHFPLIELPLMFIKLLMVDSTIKLYAFSLIDPDSR